jgi:hypothetical protein
MTESDLITLGYRYERANGARAQALRQCFNTALKQTQAPEVREHYIHNFNQGRHEARMQVGRQEIRGAR